MLFEKYNIWDGARASAVGRDGSAADAARAREGYLFLKKRYPSLRPTQRKLHCRLAARRGAAPGEWESLRGGIAALAAIVVARRFDSASTTRCRSRI